MPIGAEATLFHGALMPTYDYRCGKCGDTIEIWHAFSDPPLSRHDGCGGKLAKVLSPAGFSFKGSGFYKNDAGSRAAGRKAERTSSTSPSGPASKSEPKSAPDSSSPDSSSPEPKGKPEPTTKPDSKAAAAP